jgi:RNA polymerase sigma-70 factor (ECF subfamily)
MRVEADGELGALWERHRHALWRLSYRMTGVAADADDVVQETFARAARRPPERAGPMEPWLTSVAVNVARDLLRARRRRGYVGPWLPTPVSLEDDEIADDAGDADLERRYGVLESASFAFLLALEALTPTQRAVLVLRDVLDYSVRETARVVGSSEGAIKVAHHRARKALESYDARRVPSTQESRRENRELLERFLGALAAGDAAAVEALLADDVVVLSDGGGEYKAARRPVHGPSRVTAFLLGVARKRPPPRGGALRTLNGLPAVIVDAGEYRDRYAPRYVLQCALAPNGRIGAVYLVLATSKLARLFEPALRPRALRP